MLRTIISSRKALERARVHGLEGIEPTETALPRVEDPGRGRLTPLVTPETITTKKRKHTGE